MTLTKSYYALSLVMLLELAAGAINAAPMLAQAPKPIQTQDSTITGVVAELIECKREDGMLTVKLRFRNTSTTEKKQATIITRVGNDPNYDAYYVTAGSKKYFILRDSEKKPLASPSNTWNGELVVDIDKGGSYVWWAKYPAPPADVKKVSYYTPMTPPFDGVPIN